MRVYPDTLVFIADKANGLVQSDFKKAKVSAKSEWNLNDPTANQAKSFIFLL